MKNQQKPTTLLGHFQTIFNHFPILTTYESDYPKYAVLI